MTATASPRRLMLRRMLRSRSLLIGGGIVLFVVIVAIGAPLIAPFDPDRIGTGRRLAAPGARFLLGTDEFGRDILSRVIFGARYTLYIGLVAVGIGLLCGVVIGATAAYAGGWFGGLLMRTIDLLYTFPGRAHRSGPRGFPRPQPHQCDDRGRHQRHPVLRASHLRGRPVGAAETLCGCGQGGGREPCPSRRAASDAQCLATHDRRGVAGFSAAVLSAAALSFLGLGAQPPTPEWGLMLSTGRNYITRDPWLVIGPGVAIFITVMAFNLFGDGVRDLLDPRQRQGTR